MKQYLGSDSEENKKETCLDSLVNARLWHMVWGVLL